MPNPPRSTINSLSAGFISEGSPPSSSASEEVSTAPTDPLSVNLRGLEQEPQTFLEGKLLVFSSKCRQFEVKDILTWVEAFTIFQMALCAVFLHRWSDLTKYKLLIIQTARQLPGLAWLEYDLAFQRDAAASGLNDWSKMNLDLYNFHLRPPAPSPLQLLPSALPGPSQSLTRSRDSGVRLPFCHSWNEGQCQCPLVGASFATNAATVKVSTPRLTAHFPAPLTCSPILPPQGERGLVLTGHKRPVMPLYTV